jgi:hypothetical protein
MTRAAISITRRVDSRILFLRGQKVILDSDLAELYGVPAKRLNQQVTRNGGRFPADFRFRLSRKEYENLRLQFATSSLGHGGRRYLPYAFTEHGAIMAATVLNSERADSDEHFCSSGIRPNARSAGRKSADRGQAKRT